MSDVDEEDAMSDKTDYKEVWQLFYYYVVYIIVLLLL